MMKEWSHNKDIKVLVLRHFGKTVNHANKKQNKTTNSFSKLLHWTRKQMQLNFMQYQQQTSLCVTEHNKWNKGEQTTCIAVK